MNDTFFTKLQEVLKKTGYGQITLMLQVHEGKAVSMLSNNFEHKTYPKQDGTADAVAVFLQRLKDKKVKGETGTITGTFKLKKGQVVELVIQTNLKDYMG